MNIHSTEAGFFSGVVGCFLFGFGNRLFQAIKTTNKTRELETYTETYQT